MRPNIFEMPDFVMAYGDPSDGMFSIKNPVIQNGEKLFPKQSAWLMAFTLITFSARHLGCADLLSEFPVCGCYSTGKDEFAVCLCWNHESEYHSRIDSRRHVF